jgi:hypothetical protein
MQAAQRRDARSWPVCDLFVGVALFAAAAAFCLWQNTRIAALFDLSYLLDTSWRISLGQLPYRDFPFAHAPGTFLLHTAIIKIFGRVYWPHIACAALESGGATLLTWRILQRVLRPVSESVWMAGMLAAVLVPLGIYSVYPHPIYDGDATFAVVFALWLFVRAAEVWDSCTAGSTQGRSAFLRSFAGGAACALPLLFKQNIGLAFLTAALLAVFALSLIRRVQHQPTAAQLLFLAGVFTALTFIALAIHLAFGLHNYYQWTIAFAAARRLPGLATLFGVCHQTSLLWTIPTALLGLALLRARRFSSQLWPRALALLLLAAPFLWTLIALLLINDPDDRADQLLSLWPHLLALATILTLVQIVRFARGRVAAFHALLPLLVLATIHGTFLSQQLWGSTYAIWPLLILLIALLLIETREIATPLAAVISATLLFCGSLYAASLERLDYIHLDGQIAHATRPALRGMSTPGPWLLQFEDLVHFTDAEIPASDGIVLIPGEEPFFFATGRTPQFPVLLTDLATDPYTPQQTAEEMRARGIRWLIVKHDLQLTAPPAYETPELLQTAEQGFVLYRSLPGYDIYRHQ